MQLWTYHPAGFQVDDRQSPGIDPKLGQYWNDPAYCYESSLRLLLKRLDTAHFPLWCFTLPDCWLLSSDDVTKGEQEWELNIPESKILAFINAPVWHAIICRDGEDWENVIVKDRSPVPSKDISAVVQFPLSPECVAICRGKVVRKEWRLEAIELKKLPASTQRRRLEMYRAHAVDITGSQFSRELAARRVELLEEFLGLKQ